MTPTYQPGLYKKKSYGTLAEAQADATLEDRMFCFINGVAHRKIFGQIFPIGTFINPFSLFPAQGDFSTLYVDRNTKELYLWNGVEYVAFFELNEAAYWSSSPSPGHLFQFQIDATPGGDGFAQEVIKQSNLIGSLEDGSKGFDLQTGEWTIENDGDYLLTGQLNINKITGITSTSGGELKIELILQRNPSGTWIDDRILIQQKLRVNENEIPFNDDRIINLSSSNVAIDFTSGQLYRFVIRASEENFPIAVFDIELEVNEEFKLQAYQLQGLPEGATPEGGLGAFDAVPTTEQELLEAMSNSDITYVFNRSSEPVESEMEINGRKIIYGDPIYLSTGSSIVKNFGDEVKFICDLWVFTPALINIPGSNVLKLRKIIDTGGSLSITGSGAIVYEKSDFETITGGTFANYYQSYWDNTVQLEDTQNAEVVYKGNFTVDLSTVNPGDIYLEIPVEENDVIITSISSNQLSDQIGQAVYNVASSVNGTTVNQALRKGTFADPGNQATFSTNGNNIQLRDFGAETSGIKYEYVVRLIKSTGSTIPAFLDGDLKSDGSIPMAAGYTPSGDQDIPTKKYVDDNAGGGGNLKSDGSVPMDGGYTPGSDQQIATKKYVDDNSGPGSSVNSGNRWTFDNSSTTMADPGSGKFRLNNSDQGLATALAISKNTSNGGKDLHSILSDLDLGNILIVQDYSDVAKFIVCEISGVVIDNTDWFEIPIAPIDVGATSLLNNSECQHIQVFTGGAALLGIASFNRNLAEASQSIGGGTQGALYISANAPLQRTKVNSMITIVIQGDGAGRGRLGTYLKTFGSTVFNRFVQTGEIDFTQVGLKVAALEEGTVYLEANNDYFYGVSSLGNVQFLRYRGVNINPPYQIAHSKQNIWNQPVPTPVPDLPASFSDGSSTNDSFFVAAAYII